MRTLFLLLIPALVSAQTVGRSPLYIPAPVAAGGGAVNVVFDALAAGSLANVNTQTVSHTIVASQSNYVLFAFAVGRDGNPATVPTAMTWNGDNMTNFANVVYATSGNAMISCYYLTNPDVGTYDGVVTWSEYMSRGALVLMSVYNAAQQAPEDSTYAVMASGTAAISAQVTSATDSAFIVQVTVHEGGDGTYTWGASQTERADFNSAGGISGCGVSTLQAGAAGNYTMTATLGGTTANQITLVLAIKRKQS